MHGGLRGAIARLAEAAYAELDPGQKQIARSILLRLAGPGEAEGVVRRRVPLSELDADRDPAVGQVLQTLTSARLLTTGDGYVEVAHEALLREWPRLQSWLAEDEAGRKQRLHLMAAVRDWDQRGREASDLYRGVRLATALDWAAEHKVELNTAERESLEEGRLASQREVERQRRTNRRLRGLLVGAGSLLIVAVAAGGFAAIQLGRAESEAEAAKAAGTLARSRELTASALSVIGDDPSLSKLLAVEAASLKQPDQAAETVLHQIWAADPVIDRYTWPAGPVVTDLDPSARFIVAAGALRSPQHSLEVMDWKTDEVLWDFTPSQDGASISDPYFTVDGKSVVAGVFWEPGPDQANVEPLAEAMGV